MPPWQCFIAPNTSLVDFASPWDSSEYVPVLGSDTDRHHYTFSCFHSPSMKCHSVFSVLLLCLGCALSVVLHFSFSHFARSLSFTLHFPPICFHLTAFCFPHRSFSILSLYLRFLSLSLCFTCFYPNWYLAQMAVQLMCSGLLSECFTDLVLVRPLKLARVECVHTTLLNWWCLQVILFENGPLMLK